MRIVANQDYLESGNTKAKKNRGDGAFEKELIREQVYSSIKQLPQLATA